jgi:hypothetical protein
MNGKQSLLASRDIFPPSGRRAHIFKVRGRVLGEGRKGGGRKEREDMVSCLRRSRWWQPSRQINTVIVDYHLRYENRVYCAVCEMVPALLYVLIAETTVLDSIL